MQSDSCCFPSRLLSSLFFSCSPSRRNSDPGSHITGEHIKENLRYTQTHINFAIFSVNLWTYLLWLPVIVNSPPFPPPRHFGTSLAFCLFTRRDQYFSPSSTRAELWLSKLTYSARFQGASTTFEPGYFVFTSPWRYLWLRWAILRGMSRYDVIAQTLPHPPLCPTRPFQTGGWS